MLDNGYSLSRVELLNWGNFHGYQKFDLRKTDAEAGLFAPPPASAILGVNTSGKSTLIDGMMIVLLPFENSLKLGVTNDAESGGAGGRSIRDYVLGKHSSTNGIGQGQIADAYGRRDGCSIFLLVFTHNRLPNKSLTLGRIWWYQNYKVSETQLAILAYDPLSIPALCSEDQSPRSAKAFRLHCKASLPQVQVFETVQSYFTALSGSLGQISRDDLKILNRAFFVKSISQIDNFIRENMLLEQDSPNLDRLLENVRNGKEIATAIENCQSKIKSIERILKELRRLSSLAERKAIVDREQRILSLHKDWLDIKKCREELELLRSELVEHERSLPALRNALVEVGHQHAAIQSQIFQNDVDSRLQKLSLEIEFLKKDTNRVLADLDVVADKSKVLGVKLPGKGGDWSAFRNSLPEKTATVETVIKELRGEIETKRQEKFAIDTNAKALRDELQHISDFKTLIPRNLFSIKEDAAKELKIPGARLFFVGELIQVRPEFRHLRRAIESVLLPISRNLLCHPDHLQPLTKWLDARGLRADITVKRITNEELRSDQQTASPGADLRENYILDMIDLLPKQSHPFTEYLWTWLFHTFDYRLVEVADFRRSDGKLVTAEGLVKTDNRTMRKAKQQFDFSLGWDNHEVMADLSARLVGLNLQHQAVSRAVEAQEQELLIASDRQRFFAEIEKRCDEFADLKRKQESLEGLIANREEVLLGNPDYRQLKEQEGKWEAKLKELQRRESAIESEIASKAKKVKAIELILPGQERELVESIFYVQLAQDLGGTEQLQEALESLQSELQKKAISRLQRESQLNQEAGEIDNAIERCRSSASGNLVVYKRDFTDPNLPYDLPLNSRLSEFVEDWQKAGERLLQTDLPQAQAKWKQFFDQILMDSVKDTINEIKAKIFEIEGSIQSINEVLKLTNFEDLPTEKRYLKIHVLSSPDERIRRFRRSISEIEKLLGTGFRAQIETQSQGIMAVLVPFVEDFQKEILYRQFVTDVRNHFQFEVHSLRRGNNGTQDEIMEIFSGSRKDAKSSAQTTQLAYTLLASCLSYRFKFHDPIGGQETPRILVLDEFGGKFDNEKPKEILKLLDKMGFQSILVSPMSKADLLADGISHLVLVHKVSTTHSKVQSYHLTSKQDYDNLVRRSAEVSI